MISLKALSWPHWRMALGRPRDRDGRRGRRWTAALLAPLVSVALLSVTVTAKAATAPMMGEAEVKAAAFYNIIAFTNWPRSAFPTPDSPLIVGIVGQGPIAALIERIIAGESWHDRKITVVHFASDRQIGPCHVLFIARSERNNWANIRARCLNRPVLAVSDCDNFAEQGGNVQLAIEQNKLRIFVNLAATRATGLQLSSNLLHLSTIVGPSPDSVEPHSGLRALPFDLGALCLASLP